jgi:hypothetical protein
MTHQLHATSALIADVKKDKFQATKFSLLKLIQRMSLFSYGGNQNHHFHATVISLFMKLIARNQLLRFELRCCVKWKLYTIINTCPASADLMGNKD